jgi:hypothetical protein
MRFGSDCSAPLRVLLTGAAATLLLMMLMHWYLRRAREPAERHRRTRVLITTFVPLCGAMLLLHFVSLCSLDPACREGVDLNCHGRNPLLYEGAAIGLMIAALASILFECGYRIMRRWRRSERD